MRTVQEDPLVPAEFVLLCNHLMCCWVFNLIVNAMLKWRGLAFVLPQGSS